MNHRILFLLPCIFLAVTCRRTEEIKKKDNIEIINIDPRSTRVALLSDFFDTIYYIPLETKDSVVVGSIHKIEFFKNRVFISDNISNKVYVFNMMGKYLNSIGKKGKGPGEISKISETAVDTFTNSILIFDFNLKKELRYDFSGDFINEKTNSRWITECCLLDSAKYICRTGNYYSADSDEKTVYKINLVSGERIIKSFFPYKERPEITTYELSRIFTKTPYKLYIGQLFNDTIYEFCNEDIRPVFRINYINSGIPSSLLAKSNSRIGEKLWTNKTYAYGHQIVAENKSFIFISFIFQNQHRYCIYSKATGNASTYLTFSNDLDGGMFKSPIKTNLKDKVVCSILPSELTKYFNEARDKIKTAELVKICSEINPIDNPVLMIFKMKNGTLSLP